MNYEQAIRCFTKHELRAIAKARGLRWYSYLNKRELAFRLFSEHTMMNRFLCLLNQARRFEIPLPNDPSQWSAF